MTLKTILSADLPPTNNRLVSDCVLHNLLTVLTHKWINVNRMWCSESRVTGERDSVVLLTYFNLSSICPTPAISHIAKPTSTPLLAACIHSVPEPVAAAVSRSDKCDVIFQKCKIEKLSNMSSWQTVCDWSLKKCFAVNTRYSLE